SRTTRSSSLTPEGLLGCANQADQGSRTEALVGQGGSDDAEMRRFAPPQMKFGVLQFPGSCDDADALHAARRVGDAELLWHGERDLKGADAIVVPGGVS